MSPFRRRRAGVSYLEIQVALVVLGIALGSLCPLVVMQLKLLRKIESPGDGPDSHQMIRGVWIVNNAPYISQPDGARILQPQPDLWTRRLGSPALLQASFTSQTYGLTPIPQVVRVGDTGFSPADWPQGPGIDFYYQMSGVASPRAVAWDFTGIARGYYQVVVVDWSSDPANTSNAIFTLTGNGGLSSTSAPVDQTTPSQPTILGTFYLDQSLHVELGVPREGRVVAGAIQIIPLLNRVLIQNPVPASPSGFEVTVQVNP